MNIRPIKTLSDYNAALAEIDRLFDSPPDTLEADQLEILTTLVEAYEEQHDPIPPPHPVEALLYYMQCRGLSQRDLEPYIGSRAQVAEILNRKRALTIDMIRRLHEGLGISADVLIQSYGLIMDDSEVAA